MENSTFPTSKWNMLQEKDGKLEERRGRENNCGYVKSVATKILNLYPRKTVGIAVLPEKLNEYKKKEILMILGELVRGMQTEPQNLFGNLRELLKEVQLLTEAGFTHQAEQLMIRVVLSRVKEKLGNPIILQPQFDNRRFHGVGWRARKLLHEESTGWFSSRKTYHYEVLPHQFKGNVPKAILKATIQAKQHDLQPRVWFVAKENQFHEYLAVPKNDPAIVGYPMTDVDDSGKTIHFRYAVLIGLWGKDIEEISKIFEGR